MTLNHTFSLMTFAIGALCFVAFITTLKPPLDHSETAVGSLGVLAANPPRALWALIESEGSILLF